MAKRALAGYFLALLVLLAAALLVGGNLYARAAGDATGELERQFRSLFPEVPVPADVRSAVESEHRRLADITTSARQRSALMTLYTALSILPPETDLTLAQLSFAGATMKMEGLMPNNIGAELFAGELKRLGLHVQSLDGTIDRSGQWRFRLVVVVPEKPKRAAAEGFR